MDVYICVAVSVCIPLAKQAHTFEMGLTPSEQNIANNKALLWNITPTHTHKEAHNIKMDVYIGAALIVCVPLAKWAHLFEMRLAPTEQNIANKKALVWNITPTHTHKEAHNIKLDVYNCAALSVYVTCQAGSSV